MDDLEKSLDSGLRNPEFKKEWDALELEHEIQAELIQARSDSNMTQSELTEMSGKRECRPKN